MQGHRDLKVWRESMSLVLDIYRGTKGFPREELYGLTSQMRRAAVSIPSNLAEGHGRGSVRELRQFVSNARGSVLELQTQLEIARGLEYVTEREFRSLFEKAGNIARMLTGLRDWCTKREHR
jgi:four helix bundle protein